MKQSVEEMAKQYADTWNEDPEYRIAYDSFFAGYKAAQDQVADVSKVITYDYVETASNEARELIVKFELKGDEEVLVKALVAAYCRGVDAVDGYLRNSLSAYRASVKQQQWTSVKDRLPEMNELCIVNTEWRGVVPATYGNESWIFDDGQGWSEKALSYASHWMPLPAAPKEDK